MLRFLKSQLQNEVLYLPKAKYAGTEKKLPTGGFTLFMQSFECTITLCLRCTQDKGRKLSLDLLIKKLISL